MESNILKKMNLLWYFDINLFLDLYREDIDFIILEQNLCWCFDWFYYFYDFIKYLGR